ncbi:uncharacterized protein [Triticum aestivum]|uniref:uncharacterized protein n=1 Tax=Triticum aestivum TaxID=4565 RepID=UPI001D01CB16|nr:uncharacterized protein LOC123170054 [Triticum aestivum]
MSQMEGLGDGEGKNGSRGLAVSTAGGEDAFAGAIVSAVEDAHHESVAPVHYIGQQVSEWSAGVYITAFLRPERSFLLLGTLDSGLEFSFFCGKPASNHVDISLICPFEPTITPVSNNTWGHFSVIRGEISFFVPRRTDNARFEFGGIRLLTDEPLHYHVNVFKDGAWYLQVSKAMDSVIQRSTFISNPYCVLQREALYMMYEVGKVVAYDLLNGSFTRVHLPQDFVLSSLHGGADYRLTKSTMGMLTIVQVQGVLLRVRDRGVSGKWILRASLPFPVMFGLSEE